MSHNQTFIVPPEHPALAGHFPGNPIVPGVVLLDEVANALKLSQPDIHLSGMPSVKFLSPLLPGERCDIIFTEGRNNTIKFDCRSGDRIIANGSFSQTITAAHPT